MIVKSEAFLEVWEKYITYLEHDFGIILTADQERMRIEILNKTSHADVNVAVSIVNKTMKRGEVKLIIA